MAIWADVINLDEKKHRIACYGDKAGEQAGFYIGHLDGHPAGYMKNNRTGVEMKWKSKGYALSPEEKAKLQAQAAEKLQARAVEEERQHELTAQRISEEMTKLIPVSSPTTYLASKQIAVQSGIFTDSEGKKTYVPAHDAEGRPGPCNTYWRTEPNGLQRIHAKKAVSMR